MLVRISMRAAVVLVASIALFPVPKSIGQKPKPQHHEHKHLEREQIIALENQWNQAAISGDVDAMDKLLSEDYLGITASGEVLTKAQQLDHMRDRKLVLTKLDTSQIKIKLIRNIAIVTSLAHVEGTSDDEPLHGAYRYTRVYQRMPNGSWKITSFEVTPTTDLHAQPANPD
jgi:ketosteroid isomerase-like protein